MLLHRLCGLFLLFSPNTGQLFSDGHTGFRFFGSHRRRHGRTGFRPPCPSGVCVDHRLLRRFLLHQLIQKIIQLIPLGCCLFGDRRLLGFLPLLATLLPDYGCLDAGTIHGGKPEAFHDTVDFGGVLCPNHHIRNAVPGVLILEDAVKDAVLLRRLTEFFQIAVLHGKDLQLLAGAQHMGQAHFALGAVLVLEDGVKHHGNVLGGRTGQLCSDFCAVKRDPHDLLGFAGIAHVVLSPFSVQIFLVGFL